MDIITYALLNKKIKGLTSGVKSASVKGTSIIFTFNDDTTQTMTFNQPKDGVSITNIEINTENHLICTFSDGTSTDVGEIKTVKGEQGETGKDGKNGKDGKDGANGVDGKDGVSPTVTITDSTGKHTVTITDKEGEHTFVIKDGSALGSDDYYTKDETDTKLNEKANKSDIPTVPKNISELTNDEGYIKNTVDNLVNYYTKADTYTQTEINNIISNIKKLTAQVVDTLPVENIDTSVIYLIKQGDVTVYMQYMYINNEWAELGNTQIDLSDYVTSQKLTEELSKKADDTEIPVFTNKNTLDKISDTKVTEWDSAVTAKHTHDNKDVIDKFTENDKGIVLYNGKQIASGNLWSGTRKQYEDILNKDSNTTYIITDEEETLSDYVIDDSVATDSKTWSSKKIDGEFIHNLTTLETDWLPTSLGVEKIATKNGFLSVSFKVSSTIRISILDNGTTVWNGVCAGQTADNVYVSGFIPIIKGHKYRYEISDTSKSDTMQFYTNIFYS